MVIKSRLTKEEAERRRKEWDEYYRKCDIAITAQGRAKLNNFFFELAKKVSFQKRLQTLRALHGIPKQGFPPPRRWDTPPKNWQPKEELKPLGEEACDLCNEYGLHSDYWASPIVYFIFYSTLPSMHSEDGRDICLIQDLFYGR